MNLLPLISSFLLVFALIASSFLKDFSATVSEEATYHSYMATSQQLLNQIEKDRYAKLEGKRPKKELNPLGDKNTSKGRQHKPGKEQKKLDQKNRKTDQPQLLSDDTQQNNPKNEQKNPPEDSEEEDSPDQRIAKNIVQIENSKFNLFPLLNDIDSKEGKRKYEAAARLIKILYGQASFFDNNAEKFQYLILDKMIERGKETKGNSKNPTLFELFPTDEKHHTLFYKIFQGTKKYTLEKKPNSVKRTGYPPLHHFFTYKPEETYIVHFRYASKPVLEACFGEESCKKILEQEKSNQKVLGITDLKKILGNATSGVTADELLTGVDTNLRIKKQQKFLYSDDAKTGIAIETPNFDKEDK